MQFPTWLKWLSVLIILITTLVVPLVLFEDQSNNLVVELIQWTDDQPFITTMVVIGAIAADVFLPVPNGVVNTVAGSLFGWLYGAMVIWLGMSLGCMLGYGVGRFAGAPLAAKLVGEDDLAQAHETAQRLGAMTLVLTRTVPMFAEVTTIAAGITGFGFGRFMLITSLANVGVAVVFAGIGAAASETQSALLGFIGAVALPLVAWLVYRFLHRKEQS